MTAEEILVKAAEHAQHALVSLGLFDQAIADREQRVKDMPEVAEQLAAAKAALASTQVEVAAAEATLARVQALKDKILKELGG